MNVQKSIIALLVLLFTVPLYASGVQNQVNQKSVNKQVATYLSQGKIEALATYLGSFKKCPSDESVVVLSRLPSVCVEEKFSRNGQEKTTGYPIVVTDKNRSESEYTVRTMNVVRLDKAIEYGLTQRYQERFRSKPGVFNKKNYVDFYNTYKNTWLERDVLHVEKDIWAYEKLKSRHNYYTGYDEDLAIVMYNLTDLALGLKMRIVNVAPVEWLYDNWTPEELKYVKNYAATKGKDGVKVYGTLKRTIRNYYFARERILVYGDDEGTLGRQARALVRMLSAWKYVINKSDKSVPQNMKQDITNSIRRCFEIAKDKEKIEKIKKYNGYGLPIDICVELRGLAFQDKVYIKNAEELREEAKNKASTIVSQHIHF